MQYLKQTAPFPILQGIHRPLSRLIQYSWLILFVAVIYQVFMFLSIANLFALSCVIVGWSLVVHGLFKLDSFKVYPFSSFLIFGYALTQIYCPVIFTSIEGKSLIHNLSFPVDVFLHALLALIVLLVSHLLYRKRQNQNAGRVSYLQKVLNSLKFYTPPKVSQIWVMGILGVLALVYVQLYASDPTKDNSTTSDLIRGFIPFAYAPFFIPFSVLYGSQTVLTKGFKVKLFFYFLLLLVVSIGANSRGSFMFSFTSVGFAFLLGFFLKIFSMPRISAKSLVATGLLIYLFTGPVQDLGTAMVVVRNQREDISKVKLVEETFASFNNKKGLQDYKVMVKSDNSDWDESYLDNIFLARFCNLKFSDLSLIQCFKMGESNSRMFDFSIKKIYTALPRPLLSLIGINVSKEKYNGFSIGDYLYYLTTGNSIFLGGYRTGHFSGTGLAAFGWWYLLLLGMFIIPIYFLIDSLVLINKYSSPRFNFSLCGLLSITSVFQFLPSESVVNLVAYILRGWIQMVVLYLFMFHLTRILLSFSNKK